VWIDPVRIAERRGFRAAELRDIERVVTENSVSCWRLGMSSSAVEITLPRAVAVEAGERALTFTLSDGRSITIPLDWYPRLVEATPAERANWRLIGTGEGVHWPDLDEDISVESVVRGKPSAEGMGSLQRWRSDRRRRHG
jgi:hypothetical protein